MSLPRKPLLVLGCLASACVSEGETPWVAVPKASTAPMDTTPSVTLTGAGGFGSAVAGAGDVDGDAIDDLVVTTADGTGVVFLGGSGSLSTTPIVSLTPNEAGARVAGAGDVNGDGYDDLIANAPTADAVALFFGDTNGPGAAADMTLSSGILAVGPGDLDNDGIDDVVTLSGSGQLEVWLGAADGPTLTATLSLPFSPQWIAGAGDVNGDGRDDVILGAGNSGAAVYAGAADGLSATPLIELTGGYNFGKSGSGAGDLNGDGYDDVMVASSEPDNYYYGRVYIYAGGASGVDPTPVVTLGFENVYAGFGSAVAPAGDIDGDGLVDIMIGEPGHYKNWGAIYVYRGSASEFINHAYVAIDNPGGYSGFGESVAGAGDVNADGYYDVVAGADYMDTAYVFLGGFNGSDADADGDGVADTEDCAPDDPTVYPSATEVCDDADTDEDCDGLADDADPSVTGQSTFYLDVDGDGHAGANTVSACDAPDGAATAATDCDDDDAAIHPDSDETCNGVDDDCDGEVDPSTAVDAGSWYRDTDGDAYGAGPAQDSCAAPDGYVADSTDCDDDDASVWPGAPEIEKDGIDQDCDGADRAGDPCGCAAPTAPSALLGLAALALVRRRSARRRDRGPCPTR